MTCCGHDVIATNLSVPSDLQLQDWICFSGMGAYTYAMVSHFNSMESTVAIHSFSSSAATAPSEPVAPEEEVQESIVSSDSLCCDVMPCPLPCPNHGPQTFKEANRKLGKFARNQFSKNCIAKVSSLA